MRSAVLPNDSLVIAIEDVTFSKKTDLFREFNTSNGMFPCSDVRNGTYLLISTAMRET